MDGNIIGYSERGKYSDTLSDEVKEMLKQMNHTGDNSSDNNTPSDSDNENHIHSGGQEKPPYFHPPYTA